MLAFYLVSMIKKYMSNMLAHMYFYHTFFFLQRRKDTIKKGSDV